MSTKNIPTFDELMIPTIEALTKLGGSGTIDEILESIIEKEKYSDAIQSALHNDGPASKLEYRAAWARTYLKEAGVIDNTSRGVWALTEKGRNLDLATMPTLLTEARKSFQKKKKEKPLPEDSEGEIAEDWKSDLLQILKTKLSPDAFERLTQRLLREAGFKEVRVLGRVGDGGIDGVGILRNGLLSENVLFQCKRQNGSVSPSVVRDFRGAMQGRSSKGLIVTTGTFTSSAKEEATRDGAPPIELIDGDRLCELLKEFRLGVEVKQIEEVTITNDWFSRV